jgi:hypothetical protein
MWHCSLTLKTYIMKSFFTLLLLIILCGCSNKITPTSAVQKLDSIPYFELDGRVITNKDLPSIDPNEIALVSIYKNKEAIKRFGKQASNGAVIILTKQNATKSFESVFSSFSNSYKDVISQYTEDEIQYILNGRRLYHNYEADLAVICKKNIRSLKIIPVNDLPKDYHINDPNEINVNEKKIGIIIESKRPKNIFNSKKKL